MKRPADPEQEWRRRRLEEALREHFHDNKTAMGRALGYDSGAFMHQMLIGLRAISENTVRQVEALPGLQDWFKRPAGSGGLHISDQAEIAVLMNFRAWRARELDRAVAAHVSHAQQPPPSSEPPEAHPPPTTSQLISDPKLSSRPTRPRVPEGRRSRRKK